MKIGELEIGFCSHPMPGSNCSVESEELLCDPWELVRAMRSAVKKIKAVLEERR